MKIFKLFCLLGLMSGAASATTETDEAPTHYIEVRTQDRDSRSLITRLGYAIDEVRSDRVFFLGKLSDLEKLKRLNLKASAVPLQEKWFAIPQGANAERFSSLAEVEAKLANLAATYPDLATLSNIGRSVENREVKLLRISAKTVAQAESEKLPAVFYMGCHHAREHLSVEVPLKWAQFLLEQNGKNPDVTRLLATREVFVVPVINPDGHFYDYTNGLRGKMWRKNRARNNGGTYGVDLNRNYGYGWGTGGSSTSESSDVYMGTRPFSEPETQNVKNFIDSNPRITTLLTYHSFSELILYPWGGTYDKVGEKNGDPADYPVFVKMAGDMSKWNNYTPQQASDLYIASGGTEDWAYSTHGIFGFTFELSPASMWDGGFYPSPSVIEPTFNANVKPMLYMLEFADNPKRVLTEKIPNFADTPIKVGIGVASAKDLQY